jgi:hypothetical protein
MKRERERKREKDREKEERKKRYIDNRETERWLEGKKIQITFRLGQRDFRAFPTSDVPTGT